MRTAISLLLHDDDLRSLAEDFRIDAENQGFSVELGSGLHSIRMNVISWEFVPTAATVCMVLSLPFFAELQREAARVVFSAIKKFLQRANARGVEAPIPYRSMKNSAFMPAKARFAFVANPNAETRMFLWIDDDCSTDDATEAVRLFLRRLCV